MMNNSKSITTPLNMKDYWEHIYQKGSLLKSGWFQAIPHSSLQLIENSNISKDSKIIDIGGGDSLLVDHLMNRGYKNITVLDISQTAIEKAKKRLGERAKKVQWICTDITKFRSTQTFDLWHDRACLHFLREDLELNLYKDKLDNNLSNGGHLILGTFSKTGQKKCSGLDVNRYDAEELADFFSGNFELHENFESVHVTPSKSTQNYVFCRFKMK